MQDTAVPQALCEWRLCHSIACDAVLVVLQGAVTSAQGAIWPEPAALHALCHQSLPTRLVSQLCIKKHRVCRELSRALREQSGLSPLHCIPYAIIHCAHGLSHSFALRNTGSTGSCHEH